MPPTKPPCSDTTTTLHPALVLEGMPGAGKTTAAATLAAENHTVIGEYTTTTGDVVPIEAHPAVDDDAGHQQNWLLKHHQVHAARHRGPVYVDRDWLSALAYAYSTAADDHGALLATRTRWVSDCLAHGNLTLGDTYVLFQLDPTVSLGRRARRLTPGHPWSSLPGLVRLVTFYTDPATALAPVHPELARRMWTATWHRLRGYSIDRTVRFLRDLVDHP